MVFYCIKPKGTRFAQRGLCSEPAKLASYWLFMIGSSESDFGCPVQAGKYILPNVSNVLKPLFICSTTK